MYNGAKTVSSINSVGKIGQINAKMKVNHHLTPYIRTIKVPEENISSKLSEITKHNLFSAISPQARETKEKNKQMGLHQTKKFLHSKGNHQQNKKTTY